jgi:hypothetical protein
MTSMPFVQLWPLYFPTFDDRKTDCQYRSQVPTKRPTHMRPSISVCDNATPTDIRQQSGYRSLLRCTTTPFARPSTAVSHLTIFDGGAEAS